MNYRFTGAIREFTLKASQLKRVSTGSTWYLIILRNFFNSLLLSKSPKISPVRFASVNRIPYRSIQTDRCSNQTIDLCFVVAEKDFATLALSIQYACKSISYFRPGSVAVIVPDLLVKTCQELLHSNGLLAPLVIPESKYVPSRIIREINMRFENRGGWILQQLLKLEYVKNAKSDGVLIVDADTILLEPREWLATDGSQVLLPTWEFHAPYYDFLNRLKIGEVNPKHTFVSHHMLMKPKVVRELLEYLDWTNLDEVLSALPAFDSQKDTSPISIDYEMYAQYIAHNKPEQVRLEKWSNYACMNKFDNYDKLTSLVTRFHGLYASVSFHNYTPGY